MIFYILQVLFISWNILLTNTETYCTDPLNGMYGIQISTKCKLYTKKLNVIIYNNIIVQAITKPAF